MAIPCRIVIDVPSEGVHWPGGPVSGIVKFTLSESTLCNKAKISLIGEANTSWYENDHIEFKKTYMGKEEIVYKHKNVWPSVIDCLPIGAHECRFAFFLPYNIPSSFQHDRGHINYSITVEFETQSDLAQIEVFKEDIIVRSYLEWVMPDEMISFQLKKILFKPLSPGNQRINLKAEIAKPYIKPGEKIDIILVVTNDTSVNIKSIKAKLVRRTVFTASCFKTSVVEEKVEDCEGETEEIPSCSVSNLTVSVPTTQEEYTINNSKLISNTYEIQVTMKLPMPHLDAVTKVPILIGERVQDVLPIQQDTYDIRVLDGDSLPPTYWEL